VNDLSTSELEAANTLAVPPIHSESEYTTHAEEPTKPWDELVDGK